MLFSRQKLIFFLICVFLTNHHIFKNGGEGIFFSRLGTQPPNSYNWM